ncbi:MAG: hypothetical protein JNJ59_18935 [Deltaproteobacteria bacterium]|nr:hypothetical protein [Deltaproteobacteria bacterium]
MNRLPLFEINASWKVSAQLDTAFTTHESHREPSVEFRAPGPSPWRHAQAWAQRAVDREDGAPLPDYIEQLDPEPPTDHLSYALGVALGRFDPHGGGILDPRTADVSHALPHGMLFLDGSLADNELTDSLGHPATAPLFAAWEVHGPKISKSTSLRDYLREKFFATHKAMYDNRPIHWPLSSADKRFVVWVNIHRMDEQTLMHALADHLVPRQIEIQGLLNDLIQARGQPDKKAAADADNRYGKLYKVKGELDGLIETLRQLSERGPLPPDSKTPAREVDARYSPDLDDGVMINSAALWPVLDPQWKDPKKWWKELASASGKKDYDWSHLAMRYFPTRVDKKCQADPSLGVAHGSFWHYHPARAYAWELRLQDEIGPEFRITEAPYRGGPGDTALRSRFIADQWQDALAAIEKEFVRRRRNAKGPIPTLTLLDPGLWTEHPGDVYELELELSKKQGLEFLILAPDEPTARATFESQNPARASNRRTFVAGLKPAELALTPDDDEAQDGDIDTEEEETDET